MKFSVIPFGSGKGTRAYRDWYMLLAIALVLLISSLAWNISLFSRVTSGERIGNSTVTSTGEMRLEKVKELFVERATERARFRSEYRFIDPSL